MVCPLYPIHWVMCYTLLILLLWTCAGHTVGATLQHLYPRFSVAQTALPNETLNTLSATEGVRTNITLHVDGLPADVSGQLELQLTSADGLRHATLEPAAFPVSNGSSSVEGQFSLRGELIGFSELRLVLSNGSEPELMQSKPTQVTVTRGKHVLDIVFVHLVVLLVLLLYVNMGATVDTQVLLTTLRRPTAPLLGLLCQYLFMPAAAYLFGWLLLRDSPPLWLGLFVTGCCPGGGGSNMWTYLLGGSLDLSIAMTFLSTCAAFVAMPCWLWLLGPSILGGADFQRPPYRNIATLLIGLVLPIAIGMAVNRFWPKAGKVLVRLLKPLCLFFLIFVTGFGTYAYWFIFKFLTWRVALGSFLLPLCGFAFGLAMALVCRRESREVVAISVETGLQNTGLAIGFLKVALSSFAPLGDIAMVVPIMVATCTPVPLGLYYGVTLLRERREGKEGKGEGFSKSPTETDCLSSSTVSTLDLTA